MKIVVDSPFLVRLSRPSLDLSTKNQPHRPSPQGEHVQKLSLTARDLEDFYLVDRDGAITLVPKSGGRTVGSGDSIVDFPAEFIK